MMKPVVNILIISIVTIALYSCHSAEEKPYIMLKNLTLDEIKTYEVQQEGNLLPGTIHGKAPQDFFPNREKYILNNSLVFIRKGNDIPLKTSYYFTPDSTVELIVYEWNVVQPGMSIAQVDSVTINEDKKWPLYEGLFYSIAEEVGKQYGHVTKGDGKTVKEKSQLWDLWKKEVYWESKEQTIELKLVWMPKMGFKHFKILLKAYNFKKK